MTTIKRLYKVFIIWYDKHCVQDSDHFLKGRKECDYGYVKTSVGLEMFYFLNGGAGT